MWAGPEEGGFSHSEPRGNELAHIRRGLIIHNKASLLVAAQIKDGILLSTGGVPVQATLFLRLWMVSVW